MKSDLDKTKEIERYLAGELSAEQQAAFETRMMQVAGIKEEVELTRRLIAAIRGYGFQLMLKRIHQEEFGDREDHFS